ncbi:hypothetical protein ACHAC9_15860 [Massilia sp. CMS3.1]|uniref:hypothetical protein n=1 Tax=Massilia sp. CMS3.1 TaxID=3373083 RepID=UPI003EE81069
MYGEQHSEKTGIAVEDIEQYCKYKIFNQVLATRLPVQSGTGGDILFCGLRSGPMSFPYDWKVFR